MSHTIFTKEDAEELRKHPSLKYTTTRTSYDFTLTEYIPKENMIEIKKADSTGGYIVTLLGEQVHTRRMLSSENSDECIVHRELEEAIKELINAFVHRRMDTHTVDLNGVKPEDRIASIDMQLYGELLA